MKKWVLEKGDYKPFERYLQCLGFTMIMSLMLGINRKVNIELLDYLLPGLDAGSVGYRLALAFLASLFAFPGWFAYGLYAANLEKREALYPRQSKGTFAYRVGRRIAKLLTVIRITGRR